MYKLKPSTISDCHSIVFWLHAKPFPTCVFHYMSFIMISIYDMTYSDIRLL